MKPADLPPKVAVIEHSVRCFKWSLFSLIPVIGLFFSFSAVRHFRKAAQVSTTLAWNPARRYLLWGNIFTAIGASYNLVVVLCLLGGAFFSGS